MPALQDIGSPQPARPLTTEEQEAISGPGYVRYYSRYGGTVPSYEPTGSMQPLRAIGLWPNPGILHQMISRNPIIASGSAKIRYYVPSLDWRIADPERATDEQLWQAEVIRANLDELPGGFSSFIRRALAMIDYGFSMFEKVWMMRDDGIIVLRDLVYLVPWTLPSVLVDESGALLGVYQISERGLVPIPRAKLVHFARLYNGRNHFGESALRPLWAYDQGKAEEWVADRISRERYGIGVMVISEPPDAKDDDVTRMQEIGADWSSGERGYVLKPADWELEFVFGGSQQPSPKERIDICDHQTARMYDDTLSELGHSAHGARAVGSEMRLSTQRQLTGMCSSLCADIEQQVLRDFYLLNGWDWAGHATVTVSGFEDDARMSRVADYAEKGLLGPITPRDERDFRRGLGVRIDWQGENTDE